MDTDPLHKAIHDETLSNEEALIELFERRDHCLASDYSQSMHTNIVRIFEEAVLDAKKAVAAHEPVVKVLKKAMTDVGRLFVAERRAAAAASTSKPEKPSQVSLALVQSQSSTRLTWRTACHRRQHH